MPIEEITEEELLSTKKLGSLFYIAVIKINEIIKWCNEHELDVQFHIKGINEWIDNHEKLTLPRFETELIELIKTSEPLRESIREIERPYKPAFELTPDELKYRDLVEAESELGKAIEALIDFPFLSQDISKDFSILRLDLLQACECWKKYREGK